MHWLTPPGTSHPEEIGSSRRRLQGAAGDPGRPQLRLPHRPGAARRRVVRRRFRRELDQHRSRRSTTTRRWQRSTRTSTATPASTATCRPTSRSASRRCSPGRARRSSSASSARTSRTCARRPSEERHERRSPGIDGIVDLHGASWSTSPRSRSRWISPRPQQLRAQARRRPPRRLHPHRRRGGRRHLPRRARPTTSSSGARRRHAHSLRRRSRLLHRHARRRPGPARATSPTCRIAPTPNAISTSSCPAASTSAPTSAAATSARSSTDVEDRARRASSSRSGTTPSCSASTPSGRRPRTGCCSFAIAAAIGDLPAAAGGVRQLAPGAPVLPGAAGGPGRRGPGGLPRRRRHLARLARRLLHGLRASRRATGS